MHQRDGAAFDSPLDALPLTPNGKVDRKALPPPVTERARRSQEPPGTATEIAIAEIWRRILGADTLDRNANFFEVGGNSISAMKVVSEVSSTMGIQVPLGAIAMDSLWQIAEHELRKSARRPDLVYFLVPAPGDRCA